MKMRPDRAKRLRTAKRAIARAAKKRGISFTKLVLRHIGPRRLTVSRAEKIAEYYQND